MDQGAELEGHGRSDTRLGPIGEELEGHARSDMGLGPMGGSWRVMEEADRKSVV